MFLRMAEQSRRFVSLDKPIDKFIEDQKNKNTLSKTRRDVSLLTEFLNSKNESRKIEEIPPKELNEYISEFIVGVRRKDGEDFEPSSLRRLICSFNRHLKACKYPCSVIEDTQFEQVSTSKACNNKHHAAYSCGTLIGNRYGQHFIVLVSLQLLV